MVLKVVLHHTLRTIIAAEHSLESKRSIFTPQIRVGSMRTAEGLSERFLGALEARGGVFCKYDVLLVLERITKFIYDAKHFGCLDHLKHRCGRICVGPDVDF